MTGSQGGQPVRMPSLGCLLEGCDGRALLFGPRVNPLSERDLGLGAAQPGVGKAGAWIRTERPQLLLSAKPIFEASQLRAVRANEEVEPFSVGEFIVLGAPSGVTSFEFLEGHWGYLLLT